MLKSLIAILVAMSTLNVNAQTTSAANSVDTPKRLTARAKAGIRSTAGIENLATGALNEVEELIKSSNLSDEEKTKRIEAVNQKRALVGIAAADVKKALLSLGTPYAVIGVVVTGAVEIIPFKFGHSWGLGLGWQGEVGVLGTVFSSGAPRWSLVTLTGPLFEVYTEVNVTQNKVGADGGIHVKFILANVINSAPVVHASDLAGIYIGGGLDVAFGPSFKAYVGGCGGDSANVRAEFPDDNYIMNKLRNCNTLMVSLSMSFNKTAPPVAIPIKPFYMWIIDTKGGDGWVPFERN